MKQIIKNMIKNIKINLRVLKLRIKHWRSKNKMIYIDEITGRVTLYTNCQLVSADSLDSKEEECISINVKYEYKNAFTLPENKTGIDNEETTQQSE